MDKDKEYPLNSEWNLWYHSIKDNNWTKRKLQTNLYVEFV